MKETAVTRIRRKKWDKNSALWQMENRIRRVMRMNICWRRIPEIWLLFCSCVNRPLPLLWGGQRSRPKPAGVRHTRVEDMVDICQTLGCYVSVLRYCSILRYCSDSRWYCSDLKILFWIKMILFWIKMILFWYWIKMILFCTHRILYCCGRVQSKAKQPQQHLQPLCSLQSSLV